MCVRMLCIVLPIGLASSLLACASACVAHFYWEFCAELRGAMNAYVIFVAKFTPGAGPNYKSLQMLQSRFPGELLEFFVLLALPSAVLCQRTDVGPQLINSHVEWGCHFTAEVKNDLFSMERGWR